jgi:ribonuclease HI
MDNSNDKKNKQEIIKTLWKWDPSVKVEKEFDPCKKCGTPVEKKIPKHTKKTLQKKFYYEYFFTCPYCKTNYMTNDAKRDVSTLKL